MGHTGVAGEDVTGEGAHRGRSAREDIDIFGRRTHIAAEVEGCTVSGGGVQKGGRVTGCARDGAVASPCRILQYPWLRRPREFLAKDRKRDRMARLDGRC